MCIRDSTAPITPHQGEAPVIPGGPGGLGGPGGEDLPIADTKSATPQQKKKAVEDNINTVEKEEGKFPTPEGGVDAVAKAGADAVGKDPKPANEAMANLKNVFGDLFNKKELMRAAVLMVGAQLTGATPGQALAFAGQQYLNRIDSAAANKQKHEQELIKSGKYNTQSIKAYQQSGDPSDLVPVAATRTGTGEFKEFYSPTGKKVNAQKFKVGEGQYVWVGADGQQITSQWHSEPSRSPGTEEYAKRIADDSKTYTDMLKGLRASASTKTDKYGNVEFATGIEPTVAGREVARWAIENDVDPTLMGELVQNAHIAAASDSKGKKVKSLTPYLNDLYVKSTIGDATLFQTKEGKTMSAEKLNMLIGGLSKQALTAGKFGEASPAQAKKLIIALSLIHISEPTRPY